MKTNVMIFNFARLDDDGLFGNWQRFVILQSLHPFRGLLIMQIDAASNAIKYVFFFSFLDHFGARTRAVQVHRTRSRRAHDTKCDC